MKDMSIATARTGRAGQAVRLAGYLCYPSDIRVTTDAGELSARRQRLGAIELCPEEYTEQCPLRRGLQGEGVGGCHRVEVNIEVGYPG